MLHIITNCSLFYMINTALEMVCEENLGSATFLISHSKHLDSVDLRGGRRGVDCKVEEAITLAVCH